MRTLVVGSFTPSVLLAVAGSSGHLESAGCDVREDAVTSSPAQFRSLLNGDLDVALTSPDNVLAYRLSPTNPLRRLVDVRIVSTVDRGQGLSLWLRPGQGRDGDDVASRLHGARVAVDVPSSGFALAMYAILESLGVGPDQYQLVTLGSTPTRLRALLAGECDVTMLNAGNDLVAEESGCRRVARASTACSPYVGTVVCVAGGVLLEPAMRLAGALRATAQDIVRGERDAETASAAQAALGLSESLAVRFVDMLKDPVEGLIVDDAPDLEGLGTIADLRRRFMPEASADPGRSDVLDGALAPSSGLVVCSP